MSLVTPMAPWHLDSAVEHVKIALAATTLIMEISWRASFFPKTSIFQAGVQDQEAGRIDLHARLAIQF